MSEHQPGPWVIDGDGVVVDVTENVTVAAVYPSNRIRNARLIAAAPEMLAALKAIAPMLPSVNEVIAKAEGRAS